MCLQIGAHRCDEWVELREICYGPHEVHANEGEDEGVFPEPDDVQPLARSELRVHIVTQAQYEGATTPASSKRRMIRERRIKTYS